MRTIWWYERVELGLDIRSSGLIVNAVDIIVGKHLVVPEVAILHVISHICLQSDV
jgi:hypothetical protein